MLQLQSQLREPFPPEDLTVSNSTPSNSKADSVAFIAKEFNITEFYADTIEILLRKAKGRQRRKKETYMLDILVQNATYRVAQRNTDNSKVNKTWAESSVYGIYNDLNHQMGLLAFPK